MKKNILEYNKLKRLKLMNEIIKCDGDYRLFCIDVDEVVYTIDKYVQGELEKRDHRATKKYREEIASETSEDMRSSLNKSFDILDAILEETEYTDYDEDTDKVVKRNYKKLDYERIYQDKHLIKSSYLYLKQILQNRRSNDFFIFISHRNPEREGIVKIIKLYELFPEIDAIETIPFHIEVGSKVVNSKANYIKDMYALDSLDNCILIDDSRTNGKDFRKHGGMDIRFLPNGFTENHTLSDHLSKISDLNPNRIQLALSYIKCARQNPDNVEEIDEFIADTVTKIKKLK